MTAAEHPVARARHRSYLPQAVVVAVAGATALWAAVSYTVGVFHDDGIYALLACSIATGGGFHYQHLAGNPAATHYPPMYPLLLAAAWRLSPDFPANVTGLLSLNALCVALAALGWWRLAVSRLVWRESAAVIAALAVTLTAPVLTLAGALLSEPLFMMMLWPTLLLGERALESGKTADVVTAGAAAGVLMLVRTHGVAALIALVGMLLVRGRWRDAIIGSAVAAVVLAPWQLWTHSASPRVPLPLEGAYGSYLGWFAIGVREGGLPFVIATARTNAREMWLLLEDQFAAGPSTLVMLAAGLAAVAMAAGALATRKRIPVTIVFTLVYLGIVKIWPYSPWRFAWAIWPLLLLLALEGYRALWHAWPRWRMAVGIAATVPALLFARADLHAYATRSWRMPAREAAAQIAPIVRWVQANTHDGDALLSEGEQVVALYAHRHAAPPIDFTAREYLVLPDDRESRDRLTAMLAAMPSRYVILLAPPMIRAADSLSANGGSLRRIATLPTGAVFEVGK
jgi:hypothetical protein